MRVEIYGTESCIYCKQAVSFCEMNAIQYNYINVRDNNNLIQLEERMGTKIKTVPQIFLDGQYIHGGFAGLKNEILNI